MDISGAGDHLDKVDIRIRQLKELMQSVIAGLPWKLPNDNIKDLVAYAVSRLNTCQTEGRASEVAPRVAFTGCKINYDKEFKMAFGDYCECYNPQGLTGEVDRPRTEPCIALYPTGNANGSWVFLSLTSKRRVKQLRWTQMVTSELVVRRMNELAGYFPVAPLFADDDLPQEPPPVDTRQINSDIGHIVNATIETEIVLADETAEQVNQPQTTAAEQVTIESVETNAGEGDPNTGVVNEPEEEPMGQELPFVPR